ncbi:hypothetical protein BA022_04360 [Diaphorobacter nitroreducens]|nr:hypothetical protein BA022_04360 [Diaphorobacter nitroreducens]
MRDRTLTQAHHAGGTRLSLSESSSQDQYTMGLVIQLNGFYLAGNYCGCTERIGQRQYRFSAK